MDAFELTEWAAYERVAGPLGPERLDYLFAQLCAVVVNVQRPKGSAARRPKDFLLKWDQGAGRVDDPAAMKAAMMTWATNHNRTLER